MKSCWQILFLICCCNRLVLGVEPVVSPSEDVSKARQQAISFLKGSQNDDGTWTSANSIGITGLVTYALLKSDVPADEPVVANALKVLTGCARQDGSICATGSRISAYETAIAVMSLQAANATGQYSELINKAISFLRSVQIDEADDVKETDPRYGGAGYSADSKRPDLSNTTMFLEALQAAGISSHDPAVQKSVIFLSRCQNLKSELNSSPAAEKINDGGFGYVVSAGERESGNEQGLRSYGSMTYAGFKSMMYAGLSPDDPRVKAALEWIKKSYSVTENPGMGSNGLYYYYYLFAKALDAAGLESLEDTAGTKHDWRAELRQRLLQSQRPNGSWLNTDSNRWMEGDPNLVTAYALITLAICEPKSDP